MKKETKQSKASWMATTSDLIIQQHPELAGRLDWNALTYSYNIGRTPKEAAEVYIKILKA